MLIHSEHKATSGATMCRNIKPLFNFNPPATPAEIEAAALQFVRKISGYNSPSRINQQVYEKAVKDVTAAASQLLSSLVTHSPEKDRDVEREKAKIRYAARFSN